MTLFTGTSTIKGTVNDGMDAAVALSIGRYLGLRHKAPVALASDTRPSARMIRSAVMAGLMSAGVDVYDLGTAPTPVLQYYVKTHPGIHGGVMVTASFEILELNGIKAISADGTDDIAFEDLTAESLEGIGNQCVPGNEVGERIDVEDRFSDYIRSIISAVDVEAIKAAHLKVCLDCVNGTAFLAAPLLLKELDVACTTVDAGTYGTGVSFFDDDTKERFGNITCDLGADLGVMIDMDADRCLFFTGDGSPVSPDKSFAVILKKVLSQRRGKVVMPVNLSSLIEDVIAEGGGLLKTCAVSERKVAKKVADQGAVIGGDSYGCLVFPEHQFCSDGLMMLAKMLECIATSGPLSRQTEDMPSYFIERVDVECPEDSKNELIQRFKESCGDVRLDTTDGVKMYTADGWVLVRPAEMRSMIRVYAQAMDPIVASQRASDVAKSIGSLIETAVADPTSE